MDDGSRESGVSSPLENDYVDGEIGEEEEEILLIEDENQESNSNTSFGFDGQQFFDKSISDHGSTKYTSRKSTGSVQTVYKVDKPSTSAIFCGKVMPKAVTQEDLKFMANFDPTKSSRNQLKKKKRYHHNDGKLIDYADNYDVCDCLRPNCVGCHFPCPTCGDTRCGHECRVNRRWIYESVLVEGTPLEFRNPHYNAFC